LIDQKFPPHLKLQPKSLVEKKILLRILNRLIEEETVFSKLSHSSTENIGSCDDEPCDDGPMSKLDGVSEFKHIYYDDEVPSC